MYGRRAQATGKVSVAQAIDPLPTDQSICSWQNIQPHAPAEAWQYTLPAPD